MSDAILQIPVSQIRSGDNDRTVFDPVALAELADSIGRLGLAEPIVVRPGDAGHYSLIAGERRFRAISQLLKWPTAPCVVRPMSDEEAASVMLAENTARRDLNPLDEARAYRKRIDRFGWDVARIARAAGVSEERIERRLLLLRLVPEAQHLVASGQMGVAHAECLADLDANRQRIALRVLSQGGGLSLPAWRAMIAELLQEQSQDAMFDLEQFWVAQAQTWAANGRGAVVNVPRSERLPRPQVGRGELGEVMLRYILELQGRGLTTEAEAVGTLYHALVRRRRVRLPPWAGKTHPPTDGAHE